MKATLNLTMNVVAFGNDCPAYYFGRASAHVDPRHSCRM